MTIAFRSLILVLFTFAPLMAAAQVNESTIEPVKEINSRQDLQSKPLKLVDSDKELKTIIERTKLGKERKSDLKKLVKDYGKQSNKYRKKKNRSDSDQLALKEIETRYKFELRQFLGEEDYRKLLVTVPLN